MVERGGTFNGGESFSFDDVRVEPDALRLWKAGRVVPVEPKAFEVLLFLVRNRGRVVGKNELLDAVWKGTHVTENALTREIALLRRALGEEARRARYIETVPTRGYRFVAELKGGESEAASGGDPSAAVAPAPGKRRGRRALYAVAVVLGLAAVAAVVLWQLRGRTAAEETVRVRRLTQVTTSTGLDTQPTLSPDGAAVAYSSNRGGDFEIYVKQLAPGGREIQITADGGHNFQPAWSPDGRHLAYHSQARGGVWLVPALGGVARRLTDFGSKPAWSPDGREIAFQSAALSDINGLQGGALPPSTLWAVAAEGGTPRRLTEVGRPSGGHGSPTFSPDGRSLVFFAFDMMMAEVWSLNLQSGELRQLAPNGQPFSDLTFAPDGRHIYCAGTFYGGTFGLWRVPVSQGRGEVMGEPEKVEGTAAVPIRHLSISADGKKIAYAAHALTSDIWQLRLSPETGEPAGPPSALYADTSRRKTNPAWSPDGRRLAFAVWRLGSPMTVWVVDADGGNAAPVTTDGFASGMPSWLPEQNRLAYVSLRSGRAGFWAKDLVTGDEKLFTEFDREITHPRLSPDGRTLAYNSRLSGPINIWTMWTDGGGARQLTSDREMAGFPAWSADGRWLAYEIQRGDRMHVAVMPAEGGEPVQLTDDPGVSWPHSFSPDGDRIAFAGLRDGVWNLYWVSRTTREQRRLTDFSKSNSYVRYPAWSPLGDRLVFEYAETTGNVWVLELE
jgi:Tol biopolymer transport system component/DNA-binding winged helix-turn-helix (wHTH) protein